MTTFTAWLKASRIPAQLFIFPSLLLGQMLYFYQTGNFSSIRFLGLFMFGLVNHFFIVYANDYADYETDRLNQTYTPFTGGSRVLVEGVLSRKSLLKATLIMMAMTILLTTYFAWLLGSFIPIVLGLVGLFLMHAYSFAPIKLSYRGFGEVLQMLGVGVVLPLLGYTVQGGLIQNLPLSIILILLPSQLAMAFGTSLPDQPSDALSNKHTSAVILGVPLARKVMVLWFVISLSLLWQVPDLRELGTPLITLTVIIMMLLIVQTLLAFNPQTLPGKPLMFWLTFMSILTNTTFVFGVSWLLWVGTA